MELLQLYHDNCKSSLTSDEIFEKILSDNINVDIAAFIYTYF